MRNQAEKARNAAFFGLIRSTARPFPALALAAVLIGLLLALIPYGVSVHVSDWRSLGRLDGGYIVRSEAFGAADGSDEDFISKMANYAGMSEGDFIATFIACGSYATGMKLATGAGAKLGSSAADNLEALVDAADYPAWDSLSSDRQQQYGTKREYDSAKFNSLMGAFGFEQTYQDFKGSGGGNLDLSTEVQRRLSRIGRIGALWAAGAGVALGELKDLLTDPSVIYGWVPEVSGNDDFTPGSYWPSNQASTIIISRGNGFILTGDYPKGKAVTYDVMSTDTVYMYIGIYNGGGSSNTIQYSIFSEGYFQYRRGYDGEGTWTSAVQRNIDGDVFYEYVIESRSLFNPWRTCSIPYFTMTSSSGVANYGMVFRQLNHDFLFNYDHSGGGSGDELPDYDGDDDTVDTYFPKPGLNDDTTWPDVLDRPDGPVTNPPTNPYNPGNQTDGNQWQNDTTQNIIPIGNINFPRLFPFSLLFDVSSLADKVEDMTITESSSGQYDVIEIPLKVGDMIDETIVLDLGPLHDLLVMIQPFVLMLLAAGLLFATIEFWRTILTG